MRSTSTIKKNSECNGKNIPKETKDTNTWRSMNSHTLKGIV